jgi:succinate dehydrogenase / fumarate reductase cytochrome b subunit
MSITHRATGALLSLGTSLLCLWLLALSAGESWFGLAVKVVVHPLGKIVLFGYSVALVFHALNGIRHLFWDRGIGLTISAVYTTGYIVLSLTLLITAMLWTVFS